MSPHWKETRLGDVLTERRETPSSESLENGEVRIVKKIRFSEGRLELRTDGKTRTGMILVRPGDVLISGINAVKGAIAVYDQEESKPIAATIHYGAYVANKDRLEVNYLWWFLRSAQFREIVRQRVPGGIKTELKPKRLLAMPVPLPPLEEQRRTATRLEALAARIREAQSLRAGASDDAQALVPSAVSHLPLGEASWTSVGSVLSSKKGAIHSGPFGSDLTHGEFVAEGVAAIGTRDIQVNEFVLASGWHVTPDRFERLKQYQIYPGDVLVTIIGGSIGRFCVVPDDVPLAFTTKHVIAMQFDPKLVIPQYASYILNFHARCRSTMFAQTAGSAQPSLNTKKVMAIEFPICPLDDQRRIAADLDVLQARVSALRELQSEAEKELAALMPSILDKAFKGEL